MGFGTFDALHPGHLHYLNELKKLGDKLIVVIARDKNVLSFKGGAAHFSEDERLQHVQETGIADTVILGDKDDLLNPLRQYHPDIIGLGYDQKADEEAIIREFPTIQIVRIEAYKPEEYKSSIIKKENGIV